MIRTLLFGPEGFEAELQGTILSRQDVELHRVGSLAEAADAVKGMHPHLILVDASLPASGKLVEALRKDPPTRGCSIVGISRGDFAAADAEILEAGANALLRLPVAPDWDVRLTRLVSVPGRRDVRLAVRLKVFGLYGEEPVPALALNLSLNGMLAEAQATLNVGDEIGLSFELPTMDAVSISGTGRIVRKAGSYKVGLEFVELEGSSPQQLGAFLASEAEL